MRIVRPDAAVSPLLVLDLDSIANRYRQLEAALSGSGRTVDIHFAVKSNPHRAVLQELDRLGCRFEVASGNELALLDGLAIDVSPVIFSAPIKTSHDIRSVADRGVRRFVVDSTAELEKVAKLAPGASIFVRLGVDSRGSVMPLSTKFGTTGEGAVELATSGRDLGLHIEGLMFHVGSQAESILVWDRALTQAAEVAEVLATRGIEIGTLDLGGGFPVRYDEPVPTVEEIGDVISAGLGRLPAVEHLVAEPGRFLVAEAGTMKATVVSHAQRGDRRWVYLDVGVYTGLAEASPTVAGLRLPIEPVRSSAADDVLTVVAGHSCDGTDVIGEVQLPGDLAEGDTLEIRNTGAYTLSYAAEFCGIPTPTVAIAAEGPTTPAESGYSVVRAVHGDRWFDVARELELRVFETQGFLDPDGTLGSYRAYEDASVFNLVFEDNQPVGVLREIWPSEAGNKTLNDLELSATGAELIRSLDPNGIVDIGTVAVLPEHQRGLAALLCYASANRTRRIAGVTHWTAGIDDVVLAFFRRIMHFPFVDIGPSVDYIGSRSTPAVLDVDRAERRMQHHDAGLVQMLVRGDFQGLVELPPPSLPRECTTVAGTTFEGSSRTARRRREPAATGRLLSRAG